MLGGLYVGEAQPEIAVKYCREALREDPDCKGAEVNLGLASLELHNWPTGWRGFKAMAEAGDRGMRIYGKNLPEWDGSPGKTVIVYGDQGIGDEIHFANCLPDAIRDCKKVIFDCHPRLVDLFTRSFPEVEVHGTRKNVVGGMEWVDHCGAEAAAALPDLSRFYRRKTNDWLGVPYLKAERNQGLDFKRPRIGISWTGGGKRTRTDLRSFPLDLLEPIIKVRPDARWFSLQYTESAARETCEFEEKTGIHVSHWPNFVETYNYDATANFVASLDLVITVTTAVHDLAGALGVPNWVLVPKRAPWRFCFKGENLPWYGSSRLFHQKNDGDWGELIGRVADELANWGKLKAA